MPEPKPLLVAIMFATILTLGIASILSSLAVVASRVAAIKGRLFHIAWVLLLLLVHFDLFWQTSAILEIETWTFATFLYVISGPIVLFFATNLLLKEAALADTESRETTNVVSPTLLVLLGIVQVWSTAGDLIFTGGLPPGAAFDAVTLPTLVALIMVQKPRAHAVGVAILWLIYVTALTLLGLNIIN